MKKKLLALLSLAAVIALCCTFVACADKAVSYTVTFVSEGTTVETQTVKEGGTVIEPNDPTLDGYVFDGWYNGDAKYDFASPVNSDLTLTAKWSVAVNPDVVSGEGTKESPYILAHPNHLMIFSEKVNDPETGWADKYFRLGADIDMASAVEYVPAGKTFTDENDNIVSRGFSGVFDGAGHTISNLKIEKIIKSGVAYVGLFGETYMANIMNLSLENIDYIAESYTDADTVGVYFGGVAGYAGNTNFTKVTVSGVLNTSMQPSNSAYVGGIAGGYNASADGEHSYITYIENCYADIETVIDEEGSLESAAVGGIVGYVINYSSTVAVINSRSDGRIYGGQFTGGIAGSVSNYVSIINCVSGAEVTATSKEVSYAGGIVGSMTGDSVIMDSFSTGKIKAPKAESNTYISYAGGIVGYCSSDDYYLYYEAGGAVVNCYYSGTVTCLGGRKSELGVSKSSDEITDTFLKETLKWQPESWIAEGADSRPSDKLISEVKTDFAVTLMSKDVVYDTLDKAFTDALGYAFVGEPETPANSAPDVFWNWELAENVNYRFYIPVVKDMTLTARWQDVSDIADTYYCSAIEGYSVTQEGSGTLALNADGTLQWITSNVMTGTYKYDGQHIIMNLHSFSIGDVSGDLVDGRATFSIEYGMSYIVDYTFEPYAPDIYGEYISSAGDLLTFSGKKSVSFESSSVAGGAYITGDYAVTGSSIALSGDKLANYFSDMSVTINGNGTLTVSLTGKDGGYSLDGVTFTKLDSVDYSDEAFIDSYNIAYVTAGTYGDPNMNRYTMIFGETGVFTYRSQYSDILGRYYWFEDGSIIKVVFDGYASTFTYDAERNIIHGILNRGSSSNRYIVATPATEGAQIGYVIGDSQTNVVYITDVSRYLVKDNVLVDDAEITGTFADGSRVTVEGSDYYVKVYNERIEGYELIAIGEEEGVYTLDGKTVKIDGIGNVTGDVAGTYSVYGDTVVIYCDDDTFIGFDYKAASSSGYVITALQPDKYQGVWYQDYEKTVDGQTTLIKNYYKLLIDGFGHTNFMYLKYPEEGVYGFNWTENWGPCTPNSTGVSVQFNEYQTADLVFYYDNNLVYSKNFGYQNETKIFVKKGYTGATEIPKIDPSLKGAYSGVVGNDTVKINLRADGTGTYAGKPFTGIYDGIDTIFFELDGTEYKIKIGANKALTLVIGDDSIALTRDGEITEMIPEAIAGTWSGEFEGMGVASGEIRTVVITTNGMDCFYNNEALTEVAYDYETNTITAKCGGLNVTMVWREEDNTISFTAVDDEQRMWIATLSKVEA